MGPAGAETRRRAVAPNRPRTEVGHPATIRTDLRMYVCTLWFAYVRTKVLQGRAGFLIGRIPPTECTARPPSKEPFQSKPFLHRVFKHRSMRFYFYVVQLYAILSFIIQFRVTNLESLKPSLKSSISNLTDSNVRISEPGSLELLFSISFYYFDS